MMTSLPCSKWVQEGQALHLQHGPIDLIVGCRGTADACTNAYKVIASNFDGVLQTLASELTLLRTPLPEELTSASSANIEQPETIKLHESAKEYGFHGQVAERMYNACLPFTRYRITPMAAVAGAVADYLLAQVSDLNGIDRIWVNNGGDISVYLAPGSVFDCGMMSDVKKNSLSGQVRLTVSKSARIGRYFGIATSGRASFGEGGRSFSLGIADAVTVVASSAARADAAATIIANHVNWPGSANRVERQPASALDPDSDLCDRMVVTQVAALTHKEVELALSNGIRTATRCFNQCLIDGAVLSLSGQTQSIGDSVTQQARLELAI